jgi:hypothetical protein
MGTTLWFRCPVVGCSYQRTFRLGVGEEADGAAYAEREAALHDEHPNHPAPAAREPEIDAAPSRSTSPNNGR